MKRVLTLLAMLLCVGMVATAGNRKRNKAETDTRNYRYELEYVQSVGDGMLNVKVWSYSRRASIAIEQCKKNAVHGVLFKGYAGKGATQPPMIRDASDISTHAEFFDAFFAEGGDYQRYVSQSILGTTQTVKVGKDHKVGVVVSVNVRQLRRDLEQAGIIRSLAHGF
uniref:hypothetical protein n=1 Tax=Alistipes sp. TaxID=1872444 RepID=UPI004055C418